MPSPSDFRPGFRLSLFDALFLLGGAVASALLWPQTWWIGFVIAFVVGHFFLFCNVFRIARNLEFIWAAVFVSCTLPTVHTGRPSWTATIATSLCTTAVVIGLELRKPSYHGVGWSIVNPRLREWWEARERGA